MEDIDYANSEQLKRYKQTLRDIRYIFKTYKRKHPDEAWECIRKLAHDPKLNLRQIKENV
jgi:hypothetical protein